jgi:hypothetical protein
MEHEAIAYDGPLAGNVDLRVEKEPDGTWPNTQEWTSGTDETHLYHFMTVAVGSLSGKPVYRYLPPEPPQG